MRFTVDHADDLAGGLTMALRSSQTNIPLSRRSPPEVGFYLCDLCGK